MGQMKCRLCGKVFRTGEFLDQHLDNRHANHTHQVSCSWQCHLLTTRALPTLQACPCKQVSMAARIKTVHRTRLQSVSTSRRHCCQSPQTSTACAVLAACMQGPASGEAVPCVWSASLISSCCRLWGRVLSVVPAPKLLHGCRAPGLASSARSALWQRSPQRVSRQHPHAQLLF